MILLFSSSHIPIHFMCAERAPVLLTRVYDWHRPRPDILAAFSGGSTEKGCQIPTFGIFQCYSRYINIWAYSWYIQYIECTTKYKLQVFQAWCYWLKIVSTWRSWCTWMWNFCNPPACWKEGEKITSNGLIFFSRTGCPHPQLDDADEVFPLNDTQQIRVYEEEAADARKKLLDRNGHGQPRPGCKQQVSSVGINMGYIINTRTSFIE